MLDQLVADLGAGDWTVRSEAARKLSELGPAAAPAVPALIAGLERVRDDPQRARAFAGVLEAIGPQARPALPLLASLVKQDGAFWGDDAFPLAVLRLGGDSAQERLAVRGLLLVPAGNWKDPEVYDLWVYVPQLVRQRAELFISVLAELAADPVAYVRRRALDTLAGFGPEAAAAATAVAAALNDADAQVRRQAAVTLALVEPARRGEALAALLDLLANPEENGQACFALQRIGEPPAPHLIALLRRQAGDAQLPSLHSLAWLGEAAVPALREELRGPAVAGRVGAARALGLLAGRAGDARADVLAALEDPDAEVRGAAAEALVEIDAGGAGPAAAHLAARLGAADGATRLRVVRLLARIGPAAGEAVPALVGLLGDPDAGLEAALALSAIDPARAAPAVPVLAEALGRCAPGGQSGPVPAAQLLGALGRIGPVAVGAVPLLRTFLREEAGYDRWHAAGALARVVPGCAAEAVSSLVRLIEKQMDPATAEDPAIILECLEVLERLGAAAAGCVPWMEAVLWDDGRRQRIYFTEVLFATLLKIDPTADARLRARVEADLRTAEGRAGAAALLADVGQAAPAGWAPLLDAARDRANRE